MSSGERESAGKKPSPHNRRQRREDPAWARRPRCLAPPISPTLAPGGVENIDRRPTVFQVGKRESSRQAADCAIARDLARKPTRINARVSYIPPDQAAHCCFARHAPARPHRAQLGAARPTTRYRADLVSARYARIVQPQINDARGRQIVGGGGGEQADKILARAVDAQAAHNATVAVEDADERMGKSCADRIKAASAVPIARRRRIDIDRQTIILVQTLGIAVAKKRNLIGVSIAAGHHAIDRHAFAFYRLQLPDIVNRPRTPRRPFAPSKVKLTPTSAPNTTTESGVQS